MKNIGYLVLAVLFFAAAYYVYWLVAQENAAEVATRSARRGGAGRGTSDLMFYIKQYQPYLTLVSSLGGIASFFFQVRVWMRGRG